ncbi:MAG: tRNA 2-thiouridine(34) synthase MnmA [Anaerovoracaceae bacterium]
MTKKVMVAMSGGVDSSVAAVLLEEQGYEICGATLKLYDNEDIGIDDRTRTCCSISDVEDAQMVANRLGIRHYVFNFGLHFGRDVIERFAESYQRGETPNPCIDCNRYIKFSRLLERALLLGYDSIATGHYANVEYDKVRGRYLLKKAKDTSKDQTYVLYAMTQQELARTLFPLGNMLKSEVREHAGAGSLVNAEKPDSQDICFVKDNDYGDFLERVMGVVSPAGDFIDKKGKVLGQHRGLIHYTIGQRKGLGVGFGQRKYVTGLDKERNTVTLGDSEDLFRSSLIAEDINLIAFEKLQEPMEVTAKTRYKQPETPATIFPMEDGRIRVEFKKPQRAITPGQAVVFYDKDIVVGGGTITTGSNKTGCEQE